MIGINEFIETKNRTTHFVAVSEVVRKNLIDNHQIPADKISLIYEFIPVADLSSAEINARREKVLSELAIPNNAFIVGASGSLNWRKAPELFIQIAAEVRKLKPDAPIYFLWVGGARAGDFALFEVNYDVDKLDLQDRVRFLEHTSNPFDYYAALDVLTLVSREDPYPLVCLEAASLGKPIICFADAGGMPEFVGDECGFVVPYLDIQTFAARILDLYANTELRERFGKNARCKVMQNHDIDVSAPRVLEIIEKYYT
jgi:glycosyltransferase involved in cell wall biosynthesis